MGKNKIISIRIFIMKGGQYASKNKSLSDIPRRKTAGHKARLHTCVQAELNLARSAGMDAQTLEHILSHSTDLLDDDLAAILTLAHHVTAERTDHSDARAHLRARFGDAGLIELAYAMNGAALLPGIKRALGYATTCDMDLMAKTRGLRT